MGDGSLSQDEIDALLQGADDMLSPSGPSPSASGGGGGAMSGAVKALRDAISAAIRNVGPSLSGYLGGRNFIISNPMIEFKSASAIKGDFPGKFVQVEMDYNGALNGKNIILFTLKDAGSISSLMMGDESGSVPSELSEAHQSTLQEFTNQFLSTMATQFGSRMGGGINATPAMVSLMQRPNDLQVPPSGNVAKISYDFSIQGIVNSKFFHIMDSNLASGITSGGGGGGGYQQQAPRQQQYYQQPAGVSGISPVKFPPLDEGIPPGVGGNIALLLDVPMTLTVELGRTTQLVQDILGLGEGSIIELDKLAGEPVDLLVNGKLIAKGEVVVIDENFGVRVTDIVSPSDRLAGLQ